MHGETLSCLALTLVPGLGRARIERLLRRFETPSRVLGLPEEDLRRLPLPAQVRSSLLRRSALRRAEKAWEKVRQRGIEVLSIFDAEYPDRLRHIHRPPLILYCRGQLDSLASPAIAVVGSRHCSLYARQVTRKLARELAALGLCIVSGMARGVDAQAHLGALETAGTTVAVLGGGVDVIYPRENRKLYQRICRRGCVASEFPCGSFPAPQNFPLRNRIISGLSLGTLITEASEFSGALITARLALEQDRDLWAVPGNITRSGSYGPNSLIKQGAGIVLSMQDVVDELPVHILERLRRDSRGPAVRDPVLSDAEEAVLNFLPVDASMHVDQLTEKTSMGASQLSAVLLQLEMKGLIEQRPGRQFSRRLR